MSRQPEPPASIAAALLPMMPFRELRTKANVADEMARAVWDALLAEGETAWRTVPQPANSWMAYRSASPSGPQYETVLVIPLPVVEPRDTEEQA